MESRNKVSLGDTHGRKLNKLRVSTTDGCNFRCFYCMPEREMMKASPNLLTPKEMLQLCNHLVDLGIEHIRLTGGEPTLRREFEQIVTKIGTLPLKSFGLTTNGYRLKELVPLLKKAGCTRINVSIDSLEKDKFRKITGRPLLTRVMEGLFEAQRAGMKVKINTVLIRNINDNEIMEFLDFSSKTAIPVRFIEYLHIGPDPSLHSRLFISADEVMDHIKKQRQYEAIPVPFDSTSVMYKDDTGAKFGFIASESKPFCSGCSRLRLSAQGLLSACLFAESGINIRNKQFLEIKEALQALIPTKPLDRPPYQPKPMSKIGG